MTAGDAGFQSQVMRELVEIVQTRVRENPENWLRVADVVDLHVSCRNQVDPRSPPDGSENQKV
jgi:hypothetical protein